MTTNHLMFVATAAALAVFGTPSATQAQGRRPRPADAASPDTRRPQRVTKALSPVQVSPEQVALPGAGYLVAAAENPVRAGQVFGLTYSFSPRIAYVLESRDYGATFAVAATLPIGPKDALDYYNRVVVSPNGAEVCFTMLQSLLCSSTASIDFKPIWTGDGSFASQGRIRGLAISADSRRLAAAGSPDGLVLFERGSDGGWARRPVDGFARDIGPYARNEAQFVDLDGNFTIAFDPWNASVIYVGNNNLPLRYDVSGRWRLLDVGKTFYHDSTIYSVLTQSNGDLLVSTCNGLFVGQARTRTGATGDVRWGRAGSTAFLRGNFSDFGTGRQGDPLAADGIFLRGYSLQEGTGRPDHLIAASSGGVYVSHDSGLTWARIEGIPDREPGTPFVLTHEYYAGTWLSDGSVLVSADIVTSVRGAKPMTLRFRVQ